MNKIKPGHLKAGGGLLLLVAAVYWRLILLPGRYIWFDHYDMCQLEVPRLQFFARSLHAGHFPLWDPHIWAGLPVLGVAQPGLAYPLNLVFLALPLWHGAIPIVTLNWWFVAIHFVAAGTLYLFCRDLKLSRSAAIFGGMAFACCGYFGSLPWLDLSNAAALTPAVFLFAMRLWRGQQVWRSSALLGLALGVSWLSGHHEIPLLNTYAVLFGSAMVCSYAAIKSSTQPVRAGAVLGGTAAALAIAVAVSAVQTLPLYEFGRLAKRWVGSPEPIGWGDTVPYAVHQQYSLPWKGLLGLIVPTPTAEFHTCAFVGVTVLLLAILGLAYSWRQPQARWVTWLGLGGLVYALGSHTPFQRLLYLALPMMDKARTPVRGLYLAGFALAVLSAFGVDAWLHRKPTRRLMLPAALGLAVLVVVAGAGGWLAPMYPSVHTHFVFKALLSLMALVALGFWSGAPRPLVSTALIALVVLDASTIAAFRITRLTPRAVCAASLFLEPSLVQRMRTQVGEGRIAVNRDELMTTPGDLFGLDQMESFVAGIPANLQRLPLGESPVRQMFGVTARMGKTADGVWIQTQTDAFPRAWVVHTSIPMGSPEQLRQSMTMIDLRQTALVSGPLNELGPCADHEPLQVSRPDSDTVILQTTLRCRGLVILSDVFYPGWRATVDGAAAPLQEVDGALRGVMVDAGRHTIEQRYRPTSVYLGAALSATGLGVVMLMLRRRL